MCDRNKGDKKMKTHKQKIQQSAAARLLTSGTDVPFGSDKYLHGMLAAFVLFWLWMLIRPYSWYNWWLENALTLVTLAVLGATFRRFRFSRLSYAMILLFLVLHTYGAHYSYNTTPIDKLMHSLMGFKRDNFDRVVHFAFGLFIAVPAWEFARRITGIGKGWSYAATSLVILAFGAFYELIEMWVALIVAPEIGTRFLGTQGDVWDSHHDMEAALIGAVLTMIAVAVLWSTWPARELQPRGKEEQKIRGAEK
jgi:putative membrane protein